MDWKRLALVSLIGAGALGTAACTDGYGYSGVSMGYGGGYYGDGYGYGDPYYGAGYYGDPYYGGGYGLGGSYFGWYGDYYYPGTGIYVYDQYRRPHRWNDSQRRYWESRRGNYRGGGNWGGFDRDRRPDRNGWNGGNRGTWNGGTWNGGDRGNWNGNRGGYNGYRGNGDRDGNRGNWRGRDGGAAVTPNASPPSYTPPTAQSAPQGRSWNGGNRGRGGWGGNRGGGRGRSRPQ